MWVIWSFIETPLRGSLATIHCEPSPIRRPFHERFAPTPEDGSDRSNRMSGSAVSNELQRGQFRNESRNGWIFSGGAAITIDREISNARGSVNPTPTNRTTTPTTIDIVIM